MVRVVLPRVCSSFVTVSSVISIHRAPSKRVQFVIKGTGRKSSLSLSLCLLFFFLISNLAKTMVRF